MLYAFLLSLSIVYYSCYLSLCTPLFSKCYLVGVSPRLYDDSKSTVQCVCQLWNSNKAPETPDWMIQCVWQLWNTHKTLQTRLYEYHTTLKYCSFIVIISNNLGLVRSPLTLNAGGPSSNSGAGRIISGQIWMSFSYSLMKSILFEDFQE